MKTLATLVFAVALTVPNASLWAISVPSENSGFEIRTTISVAKQKAYRNQLDATFRGFEARLSTMGRSGVLATLDALDTKLASLQGRKRVRSPSERFILAYLRHLVASKRNAVALSSDSTFPILPTPNAPGVGTSAPVDNTTDAVIAATVMSNPDAPKGRALTPLKEEEVAHIAVTAR